MLRFAKNSQLIVLANAGHLSNFEQSDQWNQAIRSAFLEKDSSLLSSNSDGEVSITKSKSDYPHYTLPDLLLKLSITKSIYRFQRLLNHHGSNNSTKKQEYN